HLLAAARERLTEVARVRTGVRDVVRVDRCEKAQDDDENEQTQEGEGDVVAAQPPPGEHPRALALDRTFFFRCERRGGVESEIGRGLCHSSVLPLLPRTISGRRAPAAGALLPGNAV